MTMHNQNSDAEMFNFLNIVCSMGELQIKCDAHLNIIKNARAKYYFLYGLARRLSIITNNLYFFYQTTPPAREKPLEDSEREHATIHLNSLYVNLCGAIDNIAWTFVYEFEFYPNIINIEDAPERNEINLFHKKFLPKIENINGIFDEYKKYLLTKKDWYRDVLKFRHPSTHRIPLYIPPSVLNESESEQYAYHRTQHLEEAYKLNFEKADKHFNQINSLGRFIPFFVHDPDIEPSPIYPVIITDCQNLVEITHKFLICLKSS